MAELVAMATTLREAEWGAVLPEAKANTLKQRISASLVMAERLGNCVIYSMKKEDERDNIDFMVEFSWIGRQVRSDDDLPAGLDTASSGPLGLDGFCMVLSKRFKEQFAKMVQSFRPFVIQMSKGAIKGCEKPFVVPLTGKEPEEEEEDAEAEGTVDWSGLAAFSQAVASHLVPALPDKDCMQLGEDSVRVEIVCCASAALKFGIQASQMQESKDEEAGPEQSSSSLLKRWGQALPLYFKMRKMFHSLNLSEADIAAMHLNQVAEVGRDIVLAYGNRALTRMRDLHKSAFVAAADAGSEAGAEHVSQSLAAIVEQPGAAIPADELQRLLPYASDVLAAELFKACRLVEDLQKANAMCSTSLRSVLMSTAEQLDSAWQSSELEKFRHVIVNHDEESGKVAQECEDRWVAAGQLLGNFTAIQALCRELQPGENREGLTKKAMKSITGKVWMSLHPVLNTMVLKSQPQHQPPQGPDAATSDSTAAAVAPQVAPAAT